MKDLPVRERVRLEGYDYSQNGAYFITLCVLGKQEMLSKINVGANCVRPCLSEIGEIVDKEISNLSEVYETVKVNHYIVMPNHIHMIITIERNGGRTQFAPTISQVIKQFKGSLTKQIGFSIWQKTFYDVIIRNDEEYKTKWNYIDENPAKWTEDTY